MLSWELIPPTLVGLGALIGSFAAWRKSKETSNTISGDIKTVVIETQAGLRYLVEWTRVHDIRHENLGCDSRHGQSVVPSNYKQLLADFKKKQEKSDNGPTT